MPQPCDHNEMVAHHEPGFAWRCAKCGLVYGKDETCRKCGGTGYFMEETHPCEVCHGRGITRENKEEETPAHGH